MTSEPVGVEADRSRGTVTIEWADGHRSSYSTVFLRWACPCAVCQGEWGRPGILAGLQTLPPDEFQLTDLLAVGTYAVMPVWASGHSSGIYSYEYLRTICPCEECKASD
jgi:DUF971 family protein